MAVNAFIPGNSTLYTASTTSGAVLIPSGANYQLKVANAGAVVVFMNLQSNATAVAVSTGASMALLPGVVELFTVSDSQTYAAFLSASSTSTVYLTKGSGD